MDKAALGILRELERYAANGRPFTMFTEFTRDDNRPISEVIDAIEALLTDELVEPRFKHPGMERISISISEKGREVLRSLEPSTDAGTALTA